MRSSLGCLAVLSVVAIAQHASAQSAPEYVVVQGDTCPIVAQKVYGDRTRYDVLHEANPELGPVPHHLVPGQVLKTPKPKPPAKVTFIRKDVVAATPSAHPAKLNEDLERGHKVSTLADSSAELTFKDTTRLQLSDHTLVVVLGASSTLSSAKQATPADTTLMTGELRVHLGALVGKPKAIDTPSAKTDIGGESKLSVDDKSATRVAVYQGKSSIAAAGAKVEVQSGFGSKAELGKKPTKPRPLPAAPVWSTPIPKAVLALGDAEIAAVYAPGEGGPAAAKYHVQLSRDTAFNDLLVDVRVPSEVTRFEARALKPGRYFARVSAIDADAFEGPFGPVAGLGVVRVTASPAAPGKAAEITVDGGATGDVVCGLDGAAMAKPPLPFAAGHAHVLRCAPADAPADAGELPIGEALGGPIALDDVAGEPRLVGAMIEQEVRLMVRDASGAPVRDARITSKAPPGVTVAPFREAAPGVYLTTVRRPAATSGAVVFEIGGVATRTVKLESIQPSTAPAPPTEPSQELAFWLGGQQSWTPGAIGAFAALEAMSLQPLGRGVFGLGLRGSYERSGWSAGSLAHHGDAFTFALPVTFGLAGLRRPYLSLAPQVVLGRFRGDDGRRLPRPPGVGAQIGVGFRLGSERGQALQVEVGYRLLREQASDDIQLSGVYVGLSGRLGL